MTKMLDRSESAVTGKNGNKKKRKLVFNSSDFIVVLALLAIVCGALFRSPLEKMLDERLSSTEILYTVEAYGVPDDLKTCLAVGGTLYGDDDIVLGVLKSVETELADKNALTESGGVSVNIMCTISCDGFSNADGLYIGREKTMFIAPGKSIRAYTSDYAAFTFVVKTAESVG